MIVVNGKFVSAAPTAVHRVAQELTRALARRVGSSAIMVRVPPDSGPARNDPGLPLHQTGRLKGIAWEQVSLPRALSHDDLLLNFCNMTPFATRRALTMVHDAQVFTVRDSYGRRSAWARLHARIAGRRHPGLLTVSEFARGELADMGIAPAGQIHVIPNGVDHMLHVRSEPEILARLGLVPRGFALALANLQGHKNIGLLLKAFARPEAGDLTLVLTGTRSRADFEAAGHVVPPNVLFPGYVSDGEMRALEENALVFCTPSLTEGFGLPPLEAMLFGTPALIAPCGALPEVCGPDMPQADPHNPEAWAGALQKLQTGADYWQKLSATARTRAALFTWDAAAEKLQGVLAAFPGARIAGGPAASPSDTPQRSVGATP